MSRRKQNYSDDSSDDDDGFARKRRRHSDNVDIEERLESLISRVGDKTSSSSLESNLEGLASVLEADLSNYKSKILKILCDCVKNMPQRMTVYTTLVGLLNAKNYNAGGDFIEMLVRSLKESLKAGSYPVALQILRFLSDLVNCRVIMVSSLLMLYNTFLEVTLEDNIPQVRSDWYIFAILSCLPWVGQELSQKKGPDFDRLLASIDIYLQKRQKIHVPALRVWSADEGFLPQEEYLESLWAQIQALRANKWDEDLILRPYTFFDGVLCDALQHTIPTIMLPSHHEEANYPLPRVLFRMFDYEDIPEGIPALPGPHSLERYVVEEHLNSTIHTHYLERKECVCILSAEALLSVTAVKFKIPLNYLIIETVFGQLFQLPRAPHLELFYGSLLIELCKLQPGSMPQVLAQATEVLYDRLDTMNTSCVERFSNWFAYHLSNFQFKWSWDDWSDCLACDVDMPKPKFVQETLRKSLRLSYHQRVTEIVPVNFTKLLPPKPGPYYKYEKEGSGSLPGIMVAHRLMQAIKSKCGPDEAKEILRELPKPMDVEDANSPLKTDILVQTLLFLAAKSLSHSFSAIAKFHPLLKSLGEGNGKVESEEFQICILKSLFELWKAQPQMMVVIIDKLLKTQIVECSAVTSWIFSPEMSTELTSFYVWEIMHSTIVKMTKQVSKLQKEIEDMRDKLEEHEHRKKDGFNVTDEYPTEEAIEREEDKLEELQSSQKNLFLIIFQRFIMILTEHLAQCETLGRDFNTPWYKSTIDRLQEVFLLYHEQVYKYINTLESLLFTSDIDLHILKVFQQFCALRS